MSSADLSFRAMGSRDPPDRRPAPGRVAGRPRARSRSAGGSSSDFDARLSRFRPDSELCALNADRRREVPASQPAARRGSQRRLGGRGERRSGRPDPARRDRGRRLRASRARASSPRRLREALAARPGAAPGAPRPASALARDRGRRGVRDRPPPAGRALRHRRYRQGPGGRPARRAARAATRASSSTAAATCASVATASPTSPIEVLVEHPLTSEHGARDRARRRRGRDLGDRRPGLAPRRRPLRPPSARPVHRRAGLDRPDRRDRAGADRARGRDPLEGGAALGPRRRARAARASPAA